MNRRLLLLLPALLASFRRPVAAQTMLAQNQVRLNLWTLLRASLVEETPAQDASNPALFHLSRDPAMLAVYRNGVHQRPSPAPQHDYVLAGRDVTFIAHYQDDPQPLVYCYYLAL